MASPRVAAIISSVAALSIRAPAAFARQGAGPARQQPRGA